MLLICSNIRIKFEEIRKHFDRTTKIKSFINKYKWKGISFPWERDDWKKFDMFQSITQTLKSKLFF